MDVIDLRSDTVTWPTPKMREAMANAPVGDDVYGEDPTVNQLEAESAELLGKEAGMFVVSGTMGNQSSILAQCRRGDEIILGKKAHVFQYEVGSVAALGGIQPNTIEVQPDGTLNLDEIRGAIRGDNEHYPRTRLIALENTHNMMGGAPLSLEYTQSVAEIAREHGLKLHIDGARIFNAAVAQKIPAKDLVADADSVTFCLSKGLCAPVGSVVVGSREFIKEARRIRKSLGGGMRQAGILAAAGLVAIHEMIDRLVEDHTNACLLAEGLAKIPNIKIDPTRVKTNIIFFELTEGSPLTPVELSTRLREDYNIVIRPYYSDRPLFRCLTHYWITRERVQQVIGAMQTLLA